MTLKLESGRSGGKVTVPFGASLTLNKSPKTSLQYRQNLTDHGGVDIILMTVGYDYEHRPG